MMTSTLLTSSPRDSLLQSLPRLRVLLIVTASMLVSGCVIEKSDFEKSRSPGDIPDLLSAGSYHGVSLLFELAPEDRPYPEPQNPRDPQTVADWWNHIGSLPPVFPTIERGGREVYTVGNVHQVIYEHVSFEVGGYRYRARPGAHLYVYKRRDGDFEFLFHNQPIVVPSDISWIPSVYHYSLQEAAPSGKVLTHEILQVGFASIETLPAEGAWLVNGRKFFPDSAGPLTLPNAVHATVPR